MTASEDKPRKRRWGRRAEVVPTTKLCPQCKLAGLAHLVPGQICATCEAQHAWSTLGDGDGGPIVIDHPTIDAALQRRQGEAAGEPWWRALFAWAPPIVSLGLAVLAGWLVLELMSSRSIGPLESLLDELTASARRTLGVGFLGVVLAAIALVRSRKRRHFRRLSVLTSHLVAIVICGSAAAVGGAHALGAAEYGGQYTSMPVRETLAVSSNVDRILAATVVILAPDASGDARKLAIGTGAIVGGDAQRAWIVTCSHVAMPYAAVGTRRRARDAQPVWVQLSDGRQGEAHVRWAAPPPLDVALVELEIGTPPAAVPIARDASELQPASSVTFVPNPYRDGWKVVHGELLRREAHRTPAGTYDLLITDLPVTHGDSGSGLFDARGQLVGLNTWTKLEAGTSRGISLPSETMRVLVDAIERGDVANLKE